MYFHLSNYSNNATFKIGIENFSIVTVEFKKEMNENGNISRM